MTNDEGMEYLNETVPMPSARMTYPDAQTRAAMVDGAMDVHYGADTWRDFEEGFIAQARSRVYDAITAAILAAEARGGKVTMPEATQAMLNAGAEWALDGDVPTAHHVWPAMHAAAPGWGDGT